MGCHILISLRPIFLTDPECEGKVRTCSLKPDREQTPDTKSAIDLELGISDPGTRKKNEFIW